MEALTELLRQLGITPGWIALAILLIRFLGEGVTALKNGGGLVGLWRAVMNGQNIPKPIARDYRAELAPEKSDPNDNPS